MFGTAQIETLRVMEWKLESGRSFHNGGTFNSGQGLAGSFEGKRKISRQLVEFRLGGST